MKHFICLLVLIVVCSFITVACDDFEKKMDDVNLVTSLGTENNSPTHRHFCIEPAVYLRVITQVEVVNNTDSTIVVSKSDFSNETSRVVLGGLVGNYGYNTVSGNTASSFEFEWIPQDRLFSTNNPALVNNSYRCCPFLELGETVVKNFQPYMRSFLLAIHIDGSPHYLVGCPESMELPARVNAVADVGGVRKEEDLDRSRIVRYGIGYADNAEAFLSESGIAYLPRIINFVDDRGQTGEYGLGSYGRAKMKVVITVDSPDKIGFKLESFEPF
jgi:hypothetical protein